MFQTWRYFKGGVTQRLATSTCLSLEKNRADKSFASFGFSNNVMPCRHARFPQSTPPSSPHVQLQT